MSIIEFLGYYLLAESFLLLSIVGLLYFKREFYLSLLKRKLKTFLGIDEINFKSYYNRERIDFLEKRLSHCEEIKFNNGYGDGYIDGQLNLIKEVK